MSYTFNTTQQAFNTSTKTNEVSISNACRIVLPYYNEHTKSFEIKCSDSRTRRCVITNFPDYDAQTESSETATKLFAKLQKAFDNDLKVQFIAMGVYPSGNKADIWFYDLKKA